MINIAIIDDGVNEQVYPYLSLAKDIEVNSHLEFVPRINNDSSNLSHGTICAAIIKKYAPSASLSSIKILNKQAKGVKEKLIKAIDWCIAQQINIINLSLGSIHYCDYMSIKEMVNLAYRNGLIIIAASSNRNVVTYPASLTNVIGVKCDRDHILTNDEYIYNIDPVDGIEITANAQHCLSDILGKEYTTYPSNSFAAPVITAVICQIMNRYPQIYLEELKLKLQSNSKNNVESLYPYLNLPKKIDWFQKAVLFIIGDTYHLYDNIKHYLFDVYDVISIECNRLNVGLDIILRYIIDNDSRLRNIDTIVIVNQQADGFSDYQEEQKTLKKISDQRKNIVYINDHAINHDLNIEFLDYKTKLWHPSRYRSFDFSHKDRRSITIPLIAIYDLTAINLNEVLYYLTRQFREDGYSVVAATDTCQGILYGQEFIILSEFLEKIDEMALFSFHSLINLYDPDLILFGKKGIEKENTDILDLMKHLDVDVNIFIIGGGKNDIEYLNRAIDSDAKVIILSKEIIDLEDEIRQKAKLFQFKYLKDTITFQLFTYLVSLFEAV